MLFSTQAFAAESAYDTASANARARYAENAKKCRHLEARARTNCIKLAKNDAYAALNRTYGEAVNAAKFAYARTAARCKAMPSAERRRCLRIARGERAMALGKAEEIRSAPLAMGPIS